MYIIIIFILILLTYFTINFFRKDKNLKIKQICNKQYDIIYSILFHQNILFSFLVFQNMA